MKKMYPNLYKTISWLIVFAIAMAFLESAVVVYLRELYFPEGFTFPMNPIKTNIAIVEFWREIATIIMLAGIGILVGKSSFHRFAFFLLVFAIWDIFYYVFLYVLLGWPESLFTWDVLFLVPVPWVGPVITPVIISTLMIVLAALIIRLNVRIKFIELGLLLIGSLVVIFSWILDYCNFIFQKSTEIWTISSTEELFGTSNQYIPNSFNWYIFFFGAILIILSITLYYSRNIKNQRE